MPNFHILFAIISLTILQILCQTTQTYFYNLSTFYVNNFETFFEPLSNFMLSIAVHF